MTKCPQCGSKWCGPIVCRFSGMKNEDYRRIRDAVNAYANAEIKRDTESPRWEREMRQGNPDTKPGYL